MFLSFPRRRESKKIPDQVRDRRNNKWIFLSFIAAAFFISLSCSAWADFQIPEKPDGYVSDRAALLSPQAKLQLDADLREFERQTSNQIVVATFPSMEGGSLEDISIRIAQQWKIGQKDRNNGVLFLIFKDDHQMRIEAGYGLEGVLTDALSSQIIRNEVTPYFRAGEFENGIISGVRAILSATKGEYQANAAAQNNGGGALLKMILLIIGVILIIDLVRYSTYWNGHRGYTGAYSFWEWFFTFAILWLILRALLTSRGGSSWSSRGGGGGGYSGGGGFSGGGGSFGGGGASGRW